MDPECPTCGDNSFKTERGMKAHHSQIHGESIALEEVQCVICGSMFEAYSYKDRSTCSHECQGVLMSQYHEEGVVSASPVKDYDSSDQVERVTFVCEWCGSETELRPSVADGRRFCSYSCRGEWMSGENHPQWSGGRVELECEECGDTYFEDPHRGSRSSYCSRECQGSAVFKTGPGHPNWRGGHEPYYGPSWYQQRRCARRRDQHRCQRCGDTRADLDQEPDVHHIIPFRVFGLDQHEKANRLANLITLCRDCHTVVENEYRPVEA